MASSRGGRKRGRRGRKGRISGAFQALEVGAHLAEGAELVATGGARPGMGVHAPLGFGRRLSVEDVQKVVSKATAVHHVTPLVSRLSNQGAPTGAATRHPHALSGEPLLELVEAPVEPGLDRGHRQVEHVGDLLEGEALVLLEHDHLALVLGEGHDRRLHVALHVPGQGEVEGRGVVAQHRGLAVGLEGVEAHEGPPLSTAHPVAAQVEGDLVEPRRKPRLPLERAQSPIGLEEGLLAQVAGIVLGADEPVDGSLDLAVPTQDEQIEGRPVPGEARSHELLVGAAHSSYFLETTGPPSGRNAVNQQKSTTRSGARVRFSVDIKNMTGVDMSVALGRREAGVAQKLLNRTEIRATLQEVGGEAVPQGVRADLAGDGDLADAVS